MEFVINNKAHSTTKVSPFIANYVRELRISIDLRKKGKVEKATEFAERIRKVQEEAGAVLVKAQEEMKRQADRRRKEAKLWGVRDKVMLSIKDLVFKERLAKKLVDQYVGLYIIEKVISTNVVKL